MARSFSFSILCCMILATFWSYFDLINSTNFLSQRVRFECMGSLVNWMRQEYSSNIGMITSAKDLQWIESWSEDSVVNNKELHKRERITMWIDIKTEERKREREKLILNNDGLWEGLKKKGQSLFWVKNVIQSNDLRIMQNSIMNLPKAWCDNYKCSALVGRDHI